MRMGKHRCVNGGASPTPEVEVVFLKFNENARSKYLCSRKKPAFIDLLLTNRNENLQASRCRKLEIIIEKGKINKKGGL